MTKYMQLVTMMVKMNSCLQDSPHQNHKEPKGPRLSQIVHQLLTISGSDDGHGGCINIENLGGRVGAKVQKFMNRYLANQETWPGQR